MAGPELGPLKWRSTVSISGNFLDKSKRMIEFKFFEEKLLTMILFQLK